MEQNRLAELRQKTQKLSQAALGRELDVTASTIWRWEHGRVAIPDPHKIALARRFGVSVDYLMGWESVTEREAA